MLGQFLLKARSELEQELLSLKSSDVEFKTNAFSLIEKINLLGSIIELPRILLALKTQFDEIEERNAKLKKAAADPLGDGL